LFIFVEKRKIKLTKHYYPAEVKIIEKKEDLQNMYKELVQQPSVMKERITSFPFSHVSICDWSIYSRIYC